MDDNSIDAIATDAPYGIAFMNKKWDHDIPSVNIWQETLRILKPGAHILVACGTRTYHRMVTNIEDAGFIIRDCVVWAYGSGFPKSLNISKDIDRQLGCEREVVETKKNSFGRQKGGGPDWAEGITGANIKQHDFNITTPSSPLAKQYDGYHTALKPAIELWCLAMKPISEKNIALNVIKYGTGGINVDGCRVGSETLTFESTSYLGKGEFSGQIQTRQNGLIKVNGSKTVQGRFPSNLIHDNSPEVRELFPEMKSTNKQSNSYTPNDTSRENCVQFSKHKHQFNYSDKHDTSTARYFASFPLNDDKRLVYCSKASTKERNKGLDDTKNTHPTIKPIELMRYLVRLISPPNATIYDPFMGSGSTGVATLLEGFNFIGSELDTQYYNIAQQRINHTQQQANLF